MTLAIPNRLPSTLPPEARALYTRGARTPHGILDKDRLPDSDLDAAREIADAGLGRLTLDEKYGNRLDIIRLHRNFTVADPGPIPGDPDSEHWKPGTQRMTFDAYVYLMRSFAVDRAEHGHLLAVLRDVDLSPYGSSTSRTGNIHALDVRHRTATDIDHDRCYLAHIEVAHLSVLSLHSPERQEYTAVIADSPRLYPFGEGPVTNAAQICEANPQTYGPHHREHPLGQYLPAETEDLAALTGRPVIIILSATMTEVA
jgi:hypothetical protein